MGSMPTQQREPRLVQAFVELADTLVDDYDVAEMLHGLTEYCVELLDASAAGLMLSDQRGSLQVMASSTEKTRLLELFQLQSDAGPCIEAYRTGEPVSSADLAAETGRWPAFAPEAAREGFASVHAVPLRRRGDTIGALNLFGEHTGPIPETDLRIARGLADTATIAILSERAMGRQETLTEQLQTALNNRIIIEQAKGVLAEAAELAIDDVFELLRSYARSHSTRLSHIAHRVVTHDITPDDILEHQQIH